MSTDDQRPSRFDWIHGPSGPAHEPLTLFVVNASVLIALLLAVLAFSPISACVRATMRTPLRSGGRFLAWTRS